MFLPLYFEQLRKANESATVVTSSLNVLLALRLVALGARGTTFEELDVALQGGLPQGEVSQDEDGVLAQLRDVMCSVTTDESVVLTMSNSVWASNGVAETFKEKADRLLAAGSFPLPSDASVLNEYVSRATHGLIPTVMEEIPPTALALLVSVVYFKGAWTHPFDGGDTFKECFSPFVGDAVEHPFMHKTFYPHPSCWRGVRVVKATSHNVLLLPFGEGSGEGNDPRFMAAFVLPCKEGPDSLASTATTVFEDIPAVVNTSVPIADLDLDTDGIIKATIPKFRASFSAELSPIFLNLGVTSAFDDSADFGRLSQSNTDLFISAIILHAVIDVSELGTEAAAVTVVDIDESDDEIESEENVFMDLRLTRPFLFTIVDTVLCISIFEAEIHSLEPSQSFQ